MSWGGLNPALTSWRNGINQRFAHRDTRTDGARADKAHGSSSQHQEDADGTVDAFDNDVNYLGSSTPSGNPTERRILEALKRDFEADDRGQLWIHDREIANADIGPWRERDYGGPSPHIEHCHWESKQSRERDGRPWKFTHTDALLRELENGDDDMPLTTTDVDKILGRDVIPNPYGDAKTNPTIAVSTALKAAASADVKLTQVLALLKTLTGKDFTDEQAIITGVLAGLPADKIAAGIPEGVAQQVVDLLTARMAA